MADTKYNDTYFSFTDASLTNQSILDVFVLQGVVEPDDATKLKSRFKTNREIEDFLIKNKVVTKDTVNKAYSIIFKLPYVELKSIEIPAELMKIVPEKVAKKYGILPFGQEENLLRLAISRPSDLLVNFRSGLGQIFAKKNLDVELFITGESDFQEAILQYSGRGDKLLIKQGSLPIVYLRNQVIADQYLRKFPRDFIEKYRLVVFGQNQRGYFLVATAQPDSPITRKIIDFVKRENNIKVETFATSEDDIKYVLDLWDGVIKQAAPSQTQAMPAANAVVSEGQALEESSTVADSVAPQAEAVREESNSPQSQEGRQTGDNNKPIGSVFKEWLSSDSKPDITVDQPLVPASDLPPQGSNLAVSSAPLLQDSPPEKPKEVVQLDNATPTDVGNNQQMDGPDNNIGSLIDEDIVAEDQLANIAKKGNIPEIVAAIIDFALNKHSSDIHVEPEAKSLRVRCRVDGVLKEVVRLPLSLFPPFVSRIKILSKLKIDESRIPQDGRFDVVFKNREVDVRVSTMPTVHGEKVVMRILDKSQGILSLEDLGMLGSAFEKTISSIAKPYGIILVTGPTGSGKSTTLYAVLNRISLPGVNIVTLEDPVEYEIAGINQCQVKPEIGFTFASGLRSVLRQDPNIIMVGEIRDAETAGMATHAALTGHLVLSTLHTNDTAGALPRLINMGVEPFLITSSINLVVAQRLVRRICPKCKEELKAPQKLIDELKTEIEKIPINNTKDRERIPTDFKLYYGKGCDECNHGYRGRVGIFEAMEITPEIEELAISKRPANDIKTESIKQGMITMRQDGILKAFAGITTVDEVFQAVINN